MSPQSNHDGKTVKKKGMRIMRKFAAILAAALLASAFAACDDITYPPADAELSDENMTVSGSGWMADSPGSDDKSLLPTVACIPDGEKVTGRIDGVAAREARGGLWYPEFEIRTVVEAEVIEVLPDEYYVPSNDWSYYVAKLRVLDAIRGENLPEEIYLRFTDSDRNVFDGYDSLILSMKQIGVENYLLINDRRGEYAYFPNMFETSRGAYVYMGSVIAFEKGVVTDKEYHFSYVADPGETIDAVKERILAATQGLSEDERYNAFNSFLPCDYFTAADLISTEEAEQAYAQILPDGKNAYMHELKIDGAALTGRVSISATYTRVINGFATDETVSFSRNSGEVSRSGIRYDAADLASLPDISAVIEQIDVAEVTLSDKDESTKEEYLDRWQCGVVGCYRKTADGVYGVLVVKWDGSAGCDVQYDYRYILYDGDGKGSVMNPSQIAQRLAGSGGIPKYI